LVGSKKGERKGGVVGLFWSFGVVELLSFGLSEFRGFEFRGFGVSEFRSIAVLSFGVFKLLSC